MKFINKTEEIVYPKINFTGLVNEAESLPSLMFSLGILLILS